jgi:sterol 3beta-glucosyltransferase
LSVKTLAEAIRVAVDDDEIRRRAAALGERIRSEDGVARAVKILETNLDGLRERVSA